MFRVYKPLHLAPPDNLGERHNDSNGHRTSYSTLSLWSWCFEATRRHNLWPSQIKDDCGGTMLTKSFVAATCKWWSSIARPSRRHRICTARDEFLTKVKNRHFCQSKAESEFHFLSFSVFFPPGTWMQLEINDVTSSNICPLKATWS